MGSGVRRLVKTGVLLVLLLTIPILVWSQATQLDFVKPRIVQAVDEAQLTRLRGNTHPLARAEFDRGAAPADLPLKRMLLVLQRSPEQESALRKLLDEQQDRSSPNYHRWVTPEEFGRKFGPADQDVQAVTSWLQGYGFEVARVAKGRSVIEFSGTAGQVQKAFHTAIHKYVVRGEEHWANAGDPQIPAALAPVVAGVHTLHNFLKKPQLIMTGQKINARYTPGPPPKVTLPAQNGQPAAHALAWADYATIYNINPVYSAGNYGGGTSIAVVARSDLFNGGQDVNDFRGIFGVPCCLNFNRILDGPDPGDLGGGEEFEATLDATWSSAVAPQAMIDFVVSASTDTTDGVDLSELYIIDNTLANVMTESFGDCEQHFTTAQLTNVGALAEQAAAEGITYFVASGDSGSAGCDNPNAVTVATGPLAVSGLASTPFTVAVGGTVFNENGNDGTYWNTTNAQGTFESAKSYIPENVWNDSCTAAKCGSNNANIFASGGGTSTFFAKPSWQSGVPGIPPGGFRDVPDVSLTASIHDFYILCFEGSCVPDAQGFFSFFGVGGTSASAPSFAGIMALVNQKMAQTNPAEGRQGQANYVLYSLAAAESAAHKQCNGSSTTLLPASNCIFNDITVGNNIVPGDSSQSYSSGPGYDLATGLGSVNVANLVNNWDKPTPIATTTNLTLNSSTTGPIIVNHGATVNVQVQVTQASGTATPAGDVALIDTTGAGEGISFFTLNSGSVSSTTTLLPGGSYSVGAHYPGNASFLPSDSNAVSVTVNPETSLTTLKAETLDQNLGFQPFSSGPYGSFVYLRADVTDAAGDLKHGMPTGSVDFMDGVNSLVIGSLLNSQGNTSTPNFLNSPLGGTPTGLFNLTPGPHSLTASYHGDPGFMPSNSSAVPVTITQAGTTTAVTSAGAPKGAVLTATVKTNSGGNAPSGNVTFFINGTQVGSPVAISQSVGPSTNPQTGALVGVQGSVSFTDTALANGQYTLTATYAGDANYLQSTAAPTTITLQPDFVLSPPSTNVINIASPGQSGSLSLTVTANDGFTGTVQFSCAGLPAESACNFSPASLKGSGTTNLTVTTTAPHLVAKVIRHDDGPEWGVNGVFMLAGIFLVGLPKSYRLCSRLVLLMVFAFLLVIVGCGGGGSKPAPHNDPGTPTGTFNVTITASSGARVHSTIFTLNTP